LRLHGVIQLFLLDDSERGSLTTVPAKGKELKYDLTPLIKRENRFSALVDLYPKGAQVTHPALIEDLKRRYNYCEKMAPQKPRE
jgi:hypothetical protein